MYTQSRNFIFASVVALSPFAASAQDLTAMLECRDPGAFDIESDALARTGQSHGFDCRTYRRERETSMECSGHGRATAFGEAVREYSVARRADGSVKLSVAFTQPPDRIERAVAASRASAPAGSPLSTSSVGQREDGIGELQCSTAGKRASTGSIAGQLDFRGVAPVPPMRVCAAPVADTRQPTCVQTRLGQGEYLIENVPSGDYYVTAFALESNPNRLFGVYTSSLKSCPDGQSTCPERLQRITVHPGDVRSGIDPDTLMEQLPAPLRSAATGRQ